MDLYDQMMSGRMATTDDTYDDTYDAAYGPASWRESDDVSVDDL